DAARIAGRPADEDVHVLQVVMVHARGVQPPEQITERPREGAPAGPPPPGVGLAEDRLPAPVGGQRPRDLARDEEALPEDAGAPHSGCEPGTEPAADEGWSRITAHAPPQRGTSPRARGARPTAAARPAVAPRGRRWGPRARAPGRARRRARPGPRDRRRRGPP